MKTINETFTDAEFLRMKKAKLLLGDKHRHNYSWREFLLRSCTTGVSIQYSLKGGKNKNGRTK